MKHEDFVKALKKKGTISIKDLPELLKFRLDKNEEAMYEDECISLYIPIWFDCNKAFGLDVCSEENDDWINRTTDFRPKRNRVSQLGFRQTSEGVQHLAVYRT